MLSIAGSNKNLFKLLRCVDLILILISTCCVKINAMHIYFISLHHVGRCCCCCHLESVQVNYESN